MVTNVMLLTIPGELVDSASSADTDDKKQETVEARGQISVIENEEIIVHVSGDINKPKGSSKALKTTKSVPVKTKPKSPKRGPTSLPKSRGTGFEEYFADPPMTPEEAREERKDLYHPNKPFSERIITAISRFKGRRRLTGKLTIYFNEYLVLGGIDSKQASFQSRHNPTVEEFRKLAEPVLGGVDSCYWSPDATEGWVVDFYAVAAGFFSRVLPRISGDRNHDGIVRGIKMVDNFLRYLLMHDVCNEYKENIERTLALAERALVDVPLVQSSLGKFPGVWNALLEAILSEERLEEPPLCSVEDPGLNDHVEYQSLSTLPSNFNAMEYLTMGFRLYGKPVPTDIHEMRIIRSAYYHFKITGIENIHTAELTIETPTGPRTFPTLGRVKMRHIHLENGYDVGDYMRSLPLSTTEEVFIFEKELCDKLRVGMKCQMQVGTLTNGVRYCRVLKELWPEFHIFLAQELMKGFRKHEVSSRLGPTIYEIG